MSTTSGLRNIVRHPRAILSMLRGAPRGVDYCMGWNAPSPPCSALPDRGACAAPNALRDYFEANKEGPGIWKWDHYFDIYQRHFDRFVGGAVNILEIGIYSGGSLGMWKAYFGPRCSIYGVDIEDACRVYEGDRVKVFIGDQGDRAFWKRFRDQAPPIDILIDDGGHMPEQQIVTLEEMLPHLRPGGVYLCEDIHGDTNTFSYYMSGLAAHINSMVSPVATADKGILSRTTPFQAAISSIHLYPFISVIERSQQPMESFAAPRRGTEWQPFYERASGAKDDPPMITTRPRSRQSVANGPS